MKRGREIGPPCRPANAEKGQVQFGYNGSRVAKLTSSRGHLSFLTRKVISSPTVTRSNKLMFCRPRSRGLSNYNAQHPELAIEMLFINCEWIMTRLGDIVFCNYVCHSAGSEPLRLTQPSGRTEQSLSVATPVIGHISTIHQSRLLYPAC